MRKWVTNGLLVGAMTLIVGATVSLVMPGGGSGIALAGGTVGAIAAAFLSKRQDSQAKAEILQEVRRVAKAVDEIESQIIYNAELETMGNFRDQMQQMQNQIFLSQQSQQITSDTVIQLQQIITNLAETQTRLVNLPTPRTTPKPSNFTPNFPKLESSETSPLPIARLLTWLSQRQVQVTTHRQPSGVDIVFDRLALFLGDRYGSLAPLLKKIKVSLQTGSRFRLSLADRTQVDITNCTQFCRMLKDDSFLAYYYYSPLDKVIQAAPQRSFTNFFNGDWFERFVYHKVCDLLTANNYQYECLINPDVVLANTNKFGLDLLFLVGQEPLWLECKTGQDYTAFLERYSNHRKALGINKERSFLVILDITESQTIDLTNLWDITVVNRDNFLTQISRNLDLALPPELEIRSFNNSHYVDELKEHQKTLMGLSPALDNQNGGASSANSSNSYNAVNSGSSINYSIDPREGLRANPNPQFNSDFEANLPGTLGTDSSIHNGSSSSIPAGKLSTFLRRQNLRPLPEERPLIIREFINLCSSLDTPKTLTEIKAILVNQFQNHPEISNVKLHQVLKAIAQAGVCQNQLGEIITSFNSPIASLAILEAEAIEQKCILSYASTILAFDPHYFQQPQQIEEFETVVGSKFPSELYGIIE
jgi:hypothetical protein